MSAPYPPPSEDVILPSIPGVLIPDVEPAGASFGAPEPGMYEGTGGSASLEQIDAPVESKR